MNAQDLWYAQFCAKDYARRVAKRGLKAWHDYVYACLGGVSEATAPEVWLSVVMQLAKGNK